MSNPRAGAMAANGNYRGGFLILWNDISITRLINFSIRSVTGDKADISLCLVWFEMVQNGAIRVVA